MAIFNLLRARLAFDALFAPKAVNDGDTPAYGARFIIPPDHKQVGELDALVDAVGLEKWKTAWVNVKPMLLNDRKLTSWYKADYLDKNGRPFDGFEGMYSLAAREETVAPILLDRDGRTQLTLAQGRPYSGCVVNAQVDIWAQDNRYGRGIRAKLLAVQFVADGPSFTGARADLSAFGVVDDDSLDDIA